MSNNDNLCVNTRAFEGLGTFRTNLDLNGLNEAEIDGILSRPWEGRVFLAPGYGSRTRKLMTRMANHNHGTAFIGARPETALFQRYVFGEATAVLFLEGRVALVDIDTLEPDRKSAAPSALVAYGEDDALILRRLNVKGTFLWTEAAKRTGERTLA